MKNSFVSLGGLSPIQKQGAEVYKELCATGEEFYVYSYIGDPKSIYIKCYCFDKPFFGWLNRRKLFYSIYGCQRGLALLILV